MKNFYFAIILLFSIQITAQTVSDNFEGSGNIDSWYGDDCDINTDFSNPIQNATNNSNTVLRYNDVGGLFANVQFNVDTNFDLQAYNSFSLKVFVPSDGLSGSQPNQISLKLQNNNLGEPWTTQSEIIKPITLNQWQEVVFDFENDTFINFDAGSPPPLQRSDFNRVVIQINGENNTDTVLAYIDDVMQLQTDNDDPVYDYLVWSDEFEGSGAINTSKWFHQTQLPNGGSWFNGEVQHYTDRTENSNLEGGFLNVVAKKETFTDQGVTKEYTSARLNSKFAFTYGKVEVRAKLPTGFGTWPAIWTLGKNINENGAYWENQGFGTTSWPACGEIDIMEHWGDNQNFVQSAMHTPSSFGNTSNKGGQTVSTASTDFHIYSLEWSPEKMVFQVDGVTHYIYNPEVKDESTWPFDADQYILLNFAIQGHIEASFTEDAMVVDYVRVYQEAPLSVGQHESSNKVRFYPNPVKDEINVEFQSPDQQNINLQIVDINGRVIMNKHYNTPSDISIDTSSLQSGIYVGSLNYETGSTGHFKFIKQ